MLIAYLPNEFIVEIKHHPKKHKGDQNVYDLYLLFTVNRKGAILGTAAFSVRKSCAADQWANPKTLLKGTSPLSKSINTTLNGYEHKAKMALEKGGVFQSCDEIKAAIQTTVRTQVTGKAPRGQKQHAATEVREATLPQVIEKIKTTLRRGNRPLGEKRKRLYDCAYEIIKDYYQADKATTVTQHKSSNCIPALANITRRDIQAFKEWYYKTHDHTPETRSTYLGIIAAIFRYAVDELELLSASPVPKGFTPTVKKKDRRERRILDEGEIQKVYALDDTTLSDDLLLAKYFLMLQVSTGMGYCDATSLCHKHVKRNGVSGDWQIKKPRAKSGETFTVVLSARAKHAYDKLGELAGGTNTVFNLPTLRAVNRAYKRLASRIQVPRFCTYDLRHSFAVHYMDCGGHVEDLADTMGHVHLETTRIYARISESRRSQSMKRVIAQSPLHQL